MNEPMDKFFKATAVSTLTLSALFLAGTEPAGAMFITSSDPTFGSNSLITDTITGIEWLNTKASLGLGVGQVIADLAPGALFQGFQYASLGEFDTMTAEFFGNNESPSSPQFSALATTYANLFGPGFTIGNSVFIYGDLAPIGPVNPSPSCIADQRFCNYDVYRSTIASSAFGPGGTDGTFDEQLTGASFFGQPGVGHYLVRISSADPPANPPSDPPPTGALIPMSEPGVLPVALAWLIGIPFSRLILRRRNGKMLAR